ncbi:MAG: hypothetical protein COA43_12355 [Robiginitomaculum sp.]|nr:MAG: hypothetical protein COA43_12355 [Robiginitomaculum sp.]
MSDKKKDAKPSASKVKPVEVQHKAPASVPESASVSASAVKRSEKAPKKTSKDKGATPEFNSVIHQKKDKSSDHKKGISRASAVLLALLATLAGASIGWVGPSLFKNTDQVTQVANNIRTLNTQFDRQVDKQEKAFAALQTKLDAQIKKTQSAETFALSQHQDLQNNVRDLIDKPMGVAPVTDAHIQELLTPALTDLAATINTRIDLLESSLSQDGDISITGSSALAARLSALEEERATLTLLDERIHSLQEQITYLSSQSSPVTGKISESVFPAPETERIELPDLETTQDHTKALAKALQVLIDSFPREKMFEAVHAQNKIASEKPSWLQRTLSKHIKVRDEDAPTPIATILHAEAAIKEGRIQDALDDIAKLNPPVRAIAHDWVASAKKTVKAR